MAKGGEEIKDSLVYDTRQVSKTQEGVLVNLTPRLEIWILLVIFTICFYRWPRTQISEDVSQIRQEFLSHELVIDLLVHVLDLDDAFMQFPLFILNFNSFVHVKGEH